MQVFLDPRWLLLLPLGSVILFAAWVLWNVSKQLQKEKRQRQRASEDFRNDPYYRL